MDKQERQALLEELVSLRVWVVVPMFRVRDHILGVLDNMPSWVEGVVVVDDACPDGSGSLVSARCLDPRVRVIRHDVNRGVGGAVMTGYRDAVAAGARIIVKVDGDGQMDLRQLPALVLPIASGRADYTKGTRFSSRTHIGGMPALRVVGNSILSMMSKVSTGYWNIFDPTNGYCAIEARVAAIILERQVASRYFFESDMLYHLGTVRAVVRDVPMSAIYGDETSSLEIGQIVLPFLGCHIRNTAKRFVGSYLVRDFSVASLEFIVGLLLIGFGASYAVIYLALLTAFVFGVGRVMKILRLRTYHNGLSISSRRGQDRMRHALLRAHRQRVVMPVGAAHLCVGFAGPLPSGIPAWSPA